MKSRVAIAPATIRVAVISMASTGSSSPSGRHRSTRRAELVQHQAAVEVLVEDLDRHADGRLLRRHVAQVGDQSGALLELDERRRCRGLEERVSAGAAA